ncbi:MAG: squalene--hopene cyclase, partial [Actinocrinis sp.]
AGLDGAVERGLRWMAGMQSKDGGWGAFDADNTRYLINKLPFCDFGAVIDPPSADVTAHIVEAMAIRGLERDPRTLRGVRWLLDNQEKGGSWFGRWGANHLYGTGAAVPALVEAGVARDHPAVRRAAAWLIGHQNGDGGWGEDLRSYADPAWIGRGASTPSQTAWAMLALLAAQEPGDHERAAAVRAAADRGAEYLAETQRAYGTWDEDLFTGTGFPGDFYINYHLYRLVFPLTALGRYLADRLVESP